MLSTAAAVLCGCSAGITEDPKEDEWKGYDVFINQIKINGQKSTYDEATRTFTIVHPTCTDFHNMEVTVSASLHKLYVNGQESPKKFTMDLGAPVSLKAVGGDKVEEYTLTVCNTGLPVVRITTPANREVTSKTTWMDGATMRIEKADGTLDYEGPLMIKGRGNSTWSYPKKPYALKLPSKAKILDMPKHKRWILLANWKDRTLLRNDAAFWLSRHTQSLPYTVRGQFVELEFNGEHRGNYYLCEQIKINENRVNIQDPGGLILELDTYFDEPKRFRSPKFNLPYQFKDPDEDGLTPEQEAEFKEFVTNLETLLKDKDRVQAREYLDIFDVDSSIDYMFVEELATNTDFYNYWPSEGPHSAYLYYDQGKLYSGPAWDFDYHGFLPTLATQWAGADKTIYYPALYKDPAYRQRMLEKWGQEKETLSQLTDYIDQMAEYLKLSEAINTRLWPINNAENGDEKMSYPDAIDRMKLGFTTKFNWMDSHLDRLK